MCAMQNVKIIFAEKDVSNDNVKLYCCSILIALIAWDRGRCDQRD